MLNNNKNCALNSQRFGFFKKVPGNSRKKFFDLEKALELLEKDGSVSIHHRNIQSLVIEMYKVKNKLAPTITGNIFGTMPENHYNLRNYNDFRIPFAKQFIMVLRLFPIQDHKYGILLLQSQKVSNPLTVLKNL